MICLTGSKMLRTAVVDWLRMEWKRAEETTKKGRNGGLG